MFGAAGVFNESPPIVGGVGMRAATATAGDDSAMTASAGYGDGIAFVSTDSLPSTASTVSARVGSARHAGDRHVSLGVLPNRAASRDGTIHDIDDVGGRDARAAGGGGVGGGDGGGGGDSFSYEPSGFSEKLRANLMRWRSRMPYYVPILTWLPMYSWRTALLGDAASGTSVAAVRATRLRARVA